MSTIEALESALGLTLNALGEECLTCPDCGRLVRARPEAFGLHRRVTCSDAQFAQAVDPDGYAALYAPFWSGR